MGSRGLLSRRYIQCRVGYIARYRNNGVGGISSLDNATWSVRTDTRRQQLLNYRGFIKNNKDGPSRWDGEPAKIITVFVFGIYSNAFSVESVPEFNIFNVFSYWYRRVISELEK
jgi:hypothetical protein